jgi:hypothetical protein
MFKINLKHIKHILIGAAQLVTHAKKIFTLEGKQKQMC